MLKHSKKVDHDDALDDMVSSNLEADLKEQGWLVMVLKCSRANFSHVLVCRALMQP